MWASLTKHWFLTALAVCFLIGYTAAGTLRPTLEWTTFRSGLVFAVMWAMGVTLRADTIRNSLARPGGALLAIGINVLVVPILCLPAWWLLPETYFGGLIVTAIVPCTLASASVWTRKAGGDDSIAMMTTVVTNLACIVVVPLGIWMALEQQAELGAAQQVKKLALVVVFPLLLAQSMRRFGLANWADRWKPRLSIFGQFGILVMVIFGAIASGVAVDQAGGQSGNHHQGWLALAILVMSAAAVHFVALCIGIGSARVFKMDRPSQIAVGIAGSQKTLMVGLQIALDCGVSVIPMLAFHLCQLVIDTIVAERWRHQA